VLGLGSAVEIVGPMEVRAVIRQKLEENVKRYVG